MKKQLLKMSILTIVVLFLSLYIMQVNNYNNYAENRKNILTNEAINRFEGDIKNGVEIDSNNYLIKEKNYNNNYSILGMKLSSLIEKNFNKIMNKIFREINTTILESN